MNKAEILKCDKCNVWMILAKTSGGLENGNVLIMCGVCGDIHIMIPIKEFVELAEKHRDDEKMDKLVIEFVS